MRIGILDHPPAFTDYLGEILRAWGVMNSEKVGAGELDQLTPAAMPVLLVPAMELSERQAEAILALARSGATVVALLPDPRLARAAGLTDRGLKLGPQRLRVTDLAVAGLAGEALPVIGRVCRYQGGQGVQSLAYLSLPEAYADESPGITATAVDRGRLIAFAFDLPHTLMLLRQGDPAHAEAIPAGDTCVRASWLAADLGGFDAAWIPFADLLARVLVDTVRQALPGPLPMLGHLPGESPSVVLYSGDEDAADVAASEEEFAAVRRAGGRMNLYVIPDNTQAGPEQIARWAREHDLGPHPDLRPLDGHPVAERLASYAAQVRRFEERFGIKPRTVRQHCLTWAGYTDLAECQAALGLGMDSSFLAGGGYLRHRQPGPFAAFGAALPLRVCRPDGRVIDLFQQHLHLEDDVHFGDHLGYSFKWSPAYFEAVLERLLADMAGRFHLPLAVNFHPSNWVTYSRPQGEAVLAQAREGRFPGAGPGAGVPVWSFDQWLAFQEARDRCRLHALQWDGRTLTGRLEVERAHPDLRLVLPASCDGKTLQNVTLNNQPCPLGVVQRYRERVGLVPVGADRGEQRLEARYD